MPSKIADGVWHTYAPGRTIAPYRGTECYWIGSPDEAILVDTGDGGRDAQEALEQDWIALDRPRIRAIMVTHRHHDHAGGVVWASSAFNAPVYVHPADQDAVKALFPMHCPELRAPGGVFCAGDQTIEVIHAPGHTPGQINGWLPQSRILLAGDNVLGATTSVIVPPDGDLRQYLATLRNLLALSPTTIAPGHGPVVEDAIAYLQYYLDHRLQREQQVLALLREGPKTPEALAAVIYQGEPPATIRVGALMLRGHLLALEAEGCVERNEDGLQYRLVAQRR